MEEWALLGMRRWPNVPALFGWLGLDRRGRWLIRGEVITRPQIIDTINRNYEADNHGRWFFQNGPQRGYVTLEVAPWVVHVKNGALLTHADAPVMKPSAAFLDEDGSLLLRTEYGAATIVEDELEWALACLHVGSAPLDCAILDQALHLRSGETTPITMTIGSIVLPVLRLDRNDAPARLGFVRNPTPLQGESSSERAPD